MGSPIEVQYDAGLLNQSGTESIIIGKLRSPSTTIGLNMGASSGSLYANGSSGSSGFSGIYRTNYLDGHSVVQMDLSGNVIFSNNAAVFANDKESVKIQLGSVQKVSQNEFVIGDAQNKRAIVTVTDLTTEVPFISWDYQSDRMVSDFRLVTTPNSLISVSNSSVSPESLPIKSGTTVTWTNNSVSPITIYSGTTTAAQFTANPDLGLYGDDFILGPLSTGQSASYTFNNLGAFGWFVYPTILTGQVSVSTARIASTDKYIAIENDTSETLGGRIIQLDAWGNIEWSWGEGYLYRPKDVRQLTDGSIIIST